MIITLYSYNKSRLSIMKKRKKIELICLTLACFVSNEFVCFVRVMDKCDKCGKVLFTTKWIIATFFMVCLYLWTLYRIPDSIFVFVIFVWMNLYLFKTNRTITIETAINKVNGCNIDDPLHPSLLLHVQYSR